MSGFTYKQIQEKYSITPNQLKWLIQSQKWKRKSNRKNAQRGNKNAKGNKGGPGAERRNKRALKTGEYEAIYDDLLTDEEKEIMNMDFLETRLAIKHELKLISVRERRMLERLQEIKSKKRELIITKMSKDNDGAKTEAQNTLLLINRVEDGLTRVQESKRRMLDLLDKIEAREGKYSSKGKSLADEIQAAYDKRIVGDADVE